MNKRNIPKWITIGVETSIPWPLNETKIEFEGFEITLNPESPEFSPSITFEIGSVGISYGAALHVARRFFSALSWAEGAGIRETGWSGSPKPSRVGKRSILSTGTFHFDPMYLPVPVDPKQKLALAIYREALSLNSDPYKFLGFSKILNIVAPDGPKQKKWINDNIEHVTGPYALDVIDKLRSENIDIGNHLYVSGRCAVAHAFSEPIINPDSTDDLSRMADELPLMRALAQVVIEKELGIKSRTTVWKEHLYELDGFKRILPAPLLEEIIAENSRALKLGEISLILEIGLRTRDSYPGMTAMKLAYGEITDGKLIMKLASSDETIEFLLGLDLKNEKLLFDPYDGLSYTDKGTKESLEYAIGLLDFQRDLIRNGKLQIKISGTNNTLGYTDAFLPTNIDIAGTSKNIDQEIEKIKLVLTTR